MYVVGLTGSIGMGKSTSAELFRQEGIAVHDSDAAVHELYKGAAVKLIEAAFPNTTKDGQVDRKTLGDYVIGKSNNMKKLEAIIHPLVANHREHFLEEAKAAGADMVVLDIPLLFETGSEKLCDYIVVVSTSHQEQRKRVLARDNMDEEKFEKILKAQMPDTEKRRLADFIIDSTHGIEEARIQIVEIIKTIRAL